MELGRTGPRGRATAMAKSTYLSNLQRAAVDWTGVTVDHVEYDAGTTIFSQGDPSTTVMYVISGTVRLSVVSHAGREAIVAVLDADHFFGEGCLAGQSVRIATATSVEPAVIAVVDRAEVVRVLHTRPAFADAFLGHMLHRNIRIEEDLIDQMFNSTEKRLARALLLMARYGEVETTHRALPRMSQHLLAETVGTTRSRVNFFMNKFRRLGFIEYNGTLKINNSLLTVVLRD